MRTNGARSACASRTSRTSAERTSGDQERRGEAHADEHGDRHDHAAHRRGGARSAHPQLPAEQQPRHD
jgi:hypothetical protein